MIYLAAAPGDLSMLQGQFPHIAHAAYHIGADSRLHRTAAPPTGGVLLLTCGPRLRYNDILCDQLLKECAAQDYTGIAADFPPPVTADKGELLRRLAASDIQLFIPELYAACAPGATVLVNSSISGGIFREYLKEAAAKYDSVALDLQRLMMDFTLPSPTGEGKALTIEELAELKKDRSAFYSRELCARYFTYRCHGAHRFVLFDDAATLMEKARIGRELGFSHFFLSCPEIRDILPEVAQAIKKSL